MVHAYNRALRLRQALTAGAITHPTGSLPINATTAAVFSSWDNHRACTSDVVTSTYQR
ncbi:hypothetical protein CY34DRAFT_754122 [Suillus luteus UH-Slu-Lm8-n1]|uniref:Uncharacterized protein n=1 Tax=Suillus luteus UH-Slu-Lm8-n1 TaxID=930992 RepID=A0A0D0AY46_9AGAM|nr:hypothetical protein CY34DRAFT_754122 [Suillus luteus UH-Slu-Lm8-n1]